MCRFCLNHWAFSFSLNGAAYQRYFSLPKNSLQSFDDVTDAFYNQFTSWGVFQRNNNYLLAVRMKPGERLKSYINYFQSQMTLVYNCDEDVATAAFISGLQVIYSFFKHLVKNDVTKVRDILVRAQKYMQIEEATRSAITRPLREAKGAVSPKEKSKSHSVAVHKPPR